MNDEVEVTRSATTAYGIMHPDAVNKRDDNGRLLEMMTICGITETAKRIVHFYCIFLYYASWVYREYRMYSVEVSSITIHTQVLTSDIHFNGSKLACKEDDSSYGSSSQ